MNEPIEGFKPIGLIALINDKYVFVPVEDWQDIASAIEIKPKLAPTGGISRPLPPDIYAIRKEEKKDLSLNGVLGKHHTVGE